MRHSGLWEFFECQRCGRCCTEIGLPYDGARLHDIAQNRGLSVEQLIEQYYGWIIKRGRPEAGFEPYKGEDDRRTPCPFLKDEGDKKTCVIYRDRPDGCRTYPFGTDFGRQGVDCPGARIADARLRDEECN